MRQNSMLVAIAATIGLSVLSAAPAAAMPVQSTLQATAAVVAVEKVGYYGYGYGYGYRYHRPYYRPYYNYNYYPRYYGYRHHYYRPYYPRYYGYRWGY